MKLSSFASPVDGTEICEATDVTCVLQGCADRSTIASVALALFLQALPLGYFCDRAYKRRLAGM
jgi:hypothetical protein